MSRLLARMLFPFSLIVAVALLLRGYATVGDGFAAGVLAALGALVQYVVLEHDMASRRVRARASWRFITLGLSLALCVVFGPLLFGIEPVTHFPRPNVPVIEVGALKLHTAMLFDLGIALAIYGGVVGIFDRILPTFKEPQS